MKKIILIMLILVTMTFGCSKNIKDFNEYRLIAHAMGGVNQEKRYTNSKEAFFEHYNKGTRVFEVDLVETKDGVIVARHDWNNYLYEVLEQENEKKDEQPLTLEEFKNKKINNNLTPLTFDDILDLMLEYDDFYIVTDTKSPDKDDVNRIFNKIVEEVKKKDKKLLDRIVPQIYNRDMYYVLNDIYEFNNILYTLYMDNISYNDVIEFVKNNKVSGIVMSQERYNKEFVQNLNENNVKSYVHTINDKEKIKNYISEGVYGIYTDYIYEEEMSSLLN